VRGQGDDLGVVAGFVDCFAVFVTGRNSKIARAGHPVDGRRGVVGVHTPLAARHSTVRGQGDDLGVVAGFVDCFAVFVTGRNSKIARAGRWPGGGRAVAGRWLGGGRAVAGRPDL